VSFFFGYIIDITPPSADKGKGIGKSAFYDVKHLVFVEITGKQLLCLHSK
jgi:hypothetical protein